MKITHTKYEIPVWPELNMFSAYPEIVSGHMVLPETPGWGFELDDETVGRLWVARGRQHPMWVKYASQAPARPTRVVNVCGSDSGGSAGESGPLRTPPLHAGVGTPAELESCEKRPFSRRV